jgi:hypothetical protein
MTSDRQLHRTAPDLGAVSIAELGAGRGRARLYAVRTGNGHKRLQLTLPDHSGDARESSGSQPLTAGRKNRSHGTNGRRKGE